PRTWSAGTLATRSSVISLIEFSPFLNLSKRRSGGIHLPDLDHLVAGRPVAVLIYIQSNSITETVKGARAYRCVTGFIE
ncbi:hypothetical protein, partial [Pseudomonas brassicae]|uniref:hypothetical protein n=1 Tax=Pseudomonas brassicae TaxID=2708063 RepID=UPI001FB35E80